MNVGLGTYAVEVDGLTKRFGSFTAVNNVSFKVRYGEIFGFLGPNGAGKSTTIRMLCGLLEPSAGTATVGGFDIHSEAQKVKETSGYMSQRFSLYEDLTVEENIVFYSSLYGLGEKDLQERKAWALSMAGLEGKENLIASSLSGGWKQRLALGCAILHLPPILFLDEPTGGVDPVSRRKFWDLIYSLSEQGVTIFVTTHYMDEAEHCNTIGLIYDGSLIAAGSPQELKDAMNDVTIYHMKHPELLPVLDHLTRLEGIRDATLFGDAAHILAEKKFSDPRILASILGKAGFKKPSLTTIEPNLEDAFVYYISSYDRS